MKDINVLRFVVTLPVMAAFAAQPDMPGFGMVGMAPTRQFLRLNVSNLRTPGFPFVGPPGQSLTGPCTVDLSFSDGQGTVYKRMTTHLVMDQSTHLDLMPSDLPPSPSGAPPYRVEVLPAVARETTCMLVASVETIETSSEQTDSYVIRKDNGTNGLVPIYGLVGMSPGTQFIRFNVSNQGIPGISSLDTCEVGVSFSDGGMTTIKSVTVPLALGNSAHLDLTAADLRTVSAGAARVEVLPSLVFAGSCALNSSVEVVAIATQETAAYAGQAAVTLSRAIPSSTASGWRRD
jgi:hypothetical protein